MPPNVKYPISLALADELIDVPRNGSSAAATPPPPTLDTDSGDETYFLHDIEENVVPPREPVQHENARDQQHQTDEDHHHEQHHAHRVIKHLASQIDDPEELNIDGRRLARALRDVGEFCYGVIACEVWMLEDDKLARSQGGWWHNPRLYQNSIALEELAVQDPVPVLPGVDLPGILWAETVRDGSKETLLPRSSSVFLRNRSNDALEPSNISHQHGMMKSSASGILARSLVSMEGLSHLNLHTNPHELVWRDLHSLEEDPDSAKTERLGQLIRAGLGTAAGVPFHVRDHRGIVVYYARSHKRTHSFSNVANDAFLRASAQMIGHAAALSEMRRASVEARRRHCTEASDRFKRNMIEFRKETGNVHCTATPSDQSWKDGEDDRLHFPEENCTLEDLRPRNFGWETLCHGIHSWWHKCRGGNLQVPPAMTARQALWTIFGAFCGLLVLSSLNEYYKILSDEDYFLLIGPFGALMTLQYGLTAAPASQPRNVVLGQAVAGAVSLAFTYIPESILATWLRRAVGPALGIGAMVKLGVTHPPAGAHAVLYASGQYNFGFYALVVLSSAISLVPATIVNNMSSKRQYPTYWTFLELHFLTNANRDSKL